MNEPAGSIKITDLADDILFGVFYLMDLRSVMSFRKTCRRIYEISKSRPVWLKAFDYITHLCPHRPYRLDRPLSSYTSEELESIVHKIIQLEDNWTNSSPKPSRTRHLDCSACYVSYLVPGGRWLLVGGRQGSGVVTCHDLDRPVISGSPLLNAFNSTGHKGDARRMVVGMDTAGSIHLGLALVDSDVLHTPHTVKPFAIWHVKPSEDTYSLSAEHVTSFDLVQHDFANTLVLEGEYFLRGRHTGHSSPLFEVYRWTKCAASVHMKAVVTPQPDHLPGGGMHLLPERRIIALWRAQVAIYQFGELELGGPFDASPPPSQPLWVHEFGPVISAANMALSPPIVSLNSIQFAFRTDTTMIFVRWNTHHPDVAEVPVGVQHDRLQLTLGAYRGLWWDAPAGGGRPFRAGCIRYRHPESSTRMLREFGGLDASIDVSGGPFEMETPFAPPFNVDTWGWLFDEQSGRLVIPVRSSEYEMLGARECRLLPPSYRTQSSFRSPDAALAHRRPAPMLGFQDLADDVVLDILCVMDIPSIIAMRLTSRRYFGLSKAFVVWSSAFHYAQHLCPHQPFRLPRQLSTYTADELENIVLRILKLEENWTSPHPTPRNVRLLGVPASTQSALFPGGRWLLECTQGSPALVAYDLDADDHASTALASWTQQPIQLLMTEEHDTEALKCIVAIAFRLQREWLVNTKLIEIWRVELDPDGDGLMATRLASFSLEEEALRHGAHRTSLHLQGTFFLRTLSRLNVLSQYLEVYEWAACTPAVHRKAVVFPTNVNVVSSVATRMLSGTHLLVVWEDKITIFLLDFQTVQPSSHPHPQPLPSQPLWFHTVDSGWIFTVSNPIITSNLTTVAIHTVLNVHMIKVRLHGDDVTGEVSEGTFRGVQVLRRITLGTQRGMWVATTNAAENSGPLAGFISFGHPDHDNMRLRLFGGLPLESWSAAHGGKFVAPKETSGSTNWIFDEQSGRVAAQGSNGWTIMDFA